MLMDLFWADRPYPSEKVISLEGPKPSIRFFVIKSYFFVSLISLNCAWKLEIHERPCRTGCRSPETGKM